MMSGFYCTWVGRVEFCSPAGVAGADGSSHTDSGLLPLWSACSGRWPQPPAHLGSDTRDVKRTIYAGFNHKCFQLLNVNILAVPYLLAKMQTHIVLVRHFLNIITYILSIEYWKQTQQWINPAIRPHNESKQWLYLTGQHQNSTAACLSSGLNCG